MALPLDDNNENQNAALTRFFEPEDALPTFTQALRGYHKDEVDQYLREVREARDQDAQAIADAEAEARDLQARISTLEKTLGAETPHTIEALGERLVLILRHAEEGAADALAEAQEEADRLSREARERADAFVRQASLRATQAAQELKNARREADELTARSEADAHELAARTEADANEKAMSIINEAETKAAATIADAEQRAFEVGEKSRIERIQAEEALDQIRARGEAELRELVARRREIIDSLGNIRSTIGSAMGSEWSDPVNELQTMSFSVDDLSSFERSHRLESQSPVTETEQRGEVADTSHTGLWAEGNHSVETYTAHGDTHHGATNGSIEHGSEHGSEDARGGEMDETGEDEIVEDEEF